MCGSTSNFCASEKTHSANADDIRDAVMGPRSLFDMWMLDMLDMGVSKNRGIPKSSILIGFSMK